MYNSTSYRTETMTHDLLDRMLQGRGPAALRASGACILLVAAVFVTADCIWAYARLLGSLPAAPGIKVFSRAKTASNG